MKSWSNDVTVNIEFEDEDYTVTCTAELHRENYGADADGNRGLPTTFLDDVSVHLILNERGEVVYTDSMTDPEAEELLDKIDGMIYDAVRDLYMG
jgi:hypothetical protein